MKTPFGNAFSCDILGILAVYLRQVKANCVIKLLFLNIGIKHDFPCINVCQVPREMLKTEAEGGGFQQLPRDLANVKALENNV